MKPIVLIAGLFFALGAGYAAHALGQPQPIVATIAITALTGFWWVTEAMPIAATSIIPFALFPLLGVMDHKTAAAAMGSHVILLLMASLMLSKSLERSGVHERLALYMINLVGVSGRRLVFGFMLAAAVLSMWIANMATTLMLSTMALAILARTDNKALAAPLLLGIAYAASLGGTGTLIGTPPNFIFADAYEKVTGVEFSFTRWMTIGIPIVAVGIPIIGLWLTRGLSGVNAPELPDAGPWSKAEARTLMVFAFAIIGWVTRSEPFGGWSQLLGITSAGDSTVALTAVIIMFLVPNGKGGALLDWKAASDIPWGLLLLFAGGICIAAGFRASELDQVIAQGLSGLAAAPVLLMMLALCISVSFLTEVTSNTATANLLMPLLAAVAVGTGVAPELLMIPAAISCTCAFMLPAATAPNAIIYGTGRVTIAQMVREGVVLNILIAVITALMCWVLLGQG